MTTDMIHPPYIWFGGKRSVAPAVWAALGDVDNYVEPFFGGGSVWLLRPHPARLETVNDMDGFVSNFWRSVQAEPDAVAEGLNWPVNECVPAGTMIATPSGPVPIELLRSGMDILGERDGQIVRAQIIHTRKSRADQLRAVGSLVATANHPVWTAEAGYVAACELRQGQHVGEINLSLDKIDLRMLHSVDGEQKYMGDLHLERPPDRPSALCRRYVSREETTKRAHVPCGARRPHTSGLLDTFTDKSQVAAALRSHREGRPGWLAGTRAILDCTLWAISNKSYKGRRGHPRLQVIRRGAQEMVGHAKRSEVCAWANRAYDRTTSYPGSKTQDRKGVEGAPGFRCDSQGHFCGTQGQAIIRRTSGEAGCDSYREATISRTSAAHWAILEREGVNERASRENITWAGKAGYLSGHSTSFPVSQACGKKRQCVCIGNEPSHQKGYSVSQAAIPVYNLQTSTGNYFANNILVHNCDLEARHRALCRMPEKAEFLERMKREPGYYDVERAAWWCWGLCAWIGSGWCGGEYWPDEPGRSKGRGVCDGANKLPHLGDAGQGVHRQLPHLGDVGRSVHRKRPHLRNAGLGVHRQLPHLGGAGQGECARRGEVLREWMQALADRLRNVRVCCGDWARICTRGATAHGRTVGVFLDPPYSGEAGRDNAIYQEEDLAVAHRVREWCIERQHDEGRWSCAAGGRVRIVLCGYEGEHDELEGMGWRVQAWKANGGFSNFGSEKAGKANAKRERIWYSPSCLGEADLPLLADRT